ncbi:MAG: helix-turn-helix domain-containing protein [Cyclobacteriaceae bacterium]
MDKIFIKNMVCSRCIQVVENILEQQDLAFRSVYLGEAELLAPPSEEQLLSLKHALENEGFQLLDNERAQLIEKVKNIIIQLIHRQEKVVLPVKLSVLLEEKAGVDYSYLSSLFPETEGITIEKYLIAQRIERAKELLAYDELSLSQIADKLGYSSPAHFSAQFKQVTGMPPSKFKKIASELRKPLDQL